MSLLPGVPDMSPKPVNPTVAVSSKVGRGAPRGVAAIAHSVGKPGRTQHLGNITGRPGQGISNISGSAAGAAAANHYGKTPAAGLSGMTGGNTVKPISESHGGVRMIKGSGGGIRPHVREGGLGPGRFSTPGPSDSNYSQSSEDSE